MTILNTLILKTTSNLSTQCLKSIQKNPKSKFHILSESSNLCLLLDKSHEIHVQEDENERNLLCSAKKYWQISASCVSMWLVLRQYLCMIERMHVNIWYPVELRTCASIQERSIIVLLIPARRLLTVSYIPNFPKWVIWDFYPNILPNIYFDGEINGPTTRSAVTHRTIFVMYETVQGCCTVILPAPLVQYMTRLVRDSRDKYINPELTEDIIFE